MTMQQPRVVNIQKGIPVRQSIQLSPPEADEHYFDKLLVFGLACVAAGVVGKLLVTALTPKQRK